MNVYRSVVVLECTCAGMSVFLHCGTLTYYAQEAARKNRRPWATVEQQNEDSMGEKIGVKIGPALVSEICLVAGRPWSFTIVAETDCELLAIKRSQVTLSKVFVRDGDPMIIRGHEIRAMKC